MEIRTKIKKIAAIGVGAVMAASCFGIAGLATNLSDYPAPFVDNGKWVGLIAVGSDAAAGDIIGATDIAATLAQVSGSTTGSTSISGGKEYNIPIGSALNSKFPSTMTATDLAGFYDSSVTLDINSTTNSYNVKDSLILGNGIKVTTGLAEASTSKEWGSDIWLMTNSTGQIAYNYTFKTALKANQLLTAASSTTPVELQFLGQKLTITGATASAITAQIGTEFFMNVDDTVTVMGHTVKLINVGSGSAVVVSVDGTQGTVTSANTKVNGLRFTVKTAFYSDTKAERSATMIIGADVSKSYTNGDPYIGQPTTDYDWEWVLGGLDSTTPTIGIKYSKTLLNPASTNKPLKTGASITAPDGSYFSITTGDATTASYRDYTFNGLGISDLYYGAANNTVARSAAYGLEITASGGLKNAFYTAGNSKYTDKMYVAGVQVNATNANFTVYWGNPDEGNHYQPTGIVLTNGTAATTIATIQTPDSSTGLPLKMLVNAGTVAQIYVDGVGSQDIIQNMTLSASTIKFLGSKLGTATADDLYIGATDISTLDASGRTGDGIIINSVKSNGDSDTLMLSIPSKVGTDFAIKTTISSSGTKTTTTGAAGSMSSVPVAKLDTEVTDSKAQNLILVGGTAVNRLTASVLGVTYPTYGDEAGTALSISAGKATLKLVENAFGGTNTALIVAGWDAADTRTAANVLKDYSTYSATLVGKQVVVTSTAGTITLSAPTVAAAPAPVEPVVPAA